MIIDFHAHMGKGPDGSTDLLQSHITAEEVVLPARDAGVDRTCLFPVTYDDYADANREIADAAAKYPNDIIPFARLNPKLESSIPQFRTAVEKYGFKGLKLHHGCDSFPLSLPRVAEILDMAGEYGTPVIFHSIGAVDELTALADAHPRTPIVFAHMGGLWNWQDMRKCIESARTRPNVYLGTEACLVMRCIREALDAVPDKVLFGSDAPAMHPAAELAKITLLDAPDSAKSKALGGNASRLLGLP
jgi:hypothetical protein